MAHSVLRLLLLDDDELADVLLEAAFDVDHEGDAATLPAEVLRLAALAEWVNYAGGLELANWARSATDAEVALVTAALEAPELAEARDIFAASVALRLHPNDDDAYRLAGRWNDKGTRHRAAIGAAVRKTLGPWVDLLEIDPGVLPDPAVPRPPRGLMAIEVIDEGREPRAPLRYGAATVGESVTVHLEKDPPWRDGAAQPGPPPSVIEAQRASLEKLVAESHEPLRSLFASQLEKPVALPTTQRATAVARVLERHGESLLLALGTDPRHAVQWSLPFDERGVRVGWPRVPEGVAGPVEHLARGLLRLPEQPVGDGSRFRVRYRDPEHGETTIDATVTRGPDDGDQILASATTRSVSKGGFREARATATVSLSPKRLFPPHRRRRDRRIRGEAPRGRRNAHASGEAGEDRAMTRRSKAKTPLPVLLRLLRQVPEAGHVPRGMEGEGRPARVAHREVAGAARVEERRRVCGPVGVAQPE
jgi:hypothetical protein